MLKAESAGRKLTGKDAQIQAEWTKWRDETSAEAKKVSAARAALADARPIAELSLIANPNGDYAGGRGAWTATLVSKDISVTATVKAPTARRARRTDVITMQRAVVKGATASARASGSSRVSSPRRATLRDLGTRD